MFMEQTVMIALVIGIIVLIAIIIVFVNPFNLLGKAAGSDLTGTGNPEVPSFLSACTDWAYVGCTIPNPDGTFNPRYDKSKTINMFEVCRLKTQSEYTDYSSVLAAGKQNEFWNTCKDACLGCKKTATTPATGTT